MTDALGAIVPGALSTLVGLALSSAVLLVLFIGFCILFNLPKLRRSGPHSRVVRSLDEAGGQPARYLSPDIPRGPVDQLRTPELLEVRSRKST